MTETGLKPRQYGSIVGSLSLDSLPLKIETVRIRGNLFYGAGVQGGIRTRR